MPQTPTATETDRQVRRLYDLAYRTVPIARILANPQATSDGAAYATARIPRALSAARRLLTLPGVAEHEETPYALSFLNAAELQLNAPSTTLLRIAAAARKAAARADAADDDLRVVVYQDIEEHSRYLVDAAQDEPVLGRRGWSARDRAASNTLQQWAAHWGLTHPADAPRTDLLPQTEPVPTLPAHLSRQAAARAATRTRCAAGIRCTEPNCLTYGALKVTFPASAWLCTNCIPAVNTRLAAGGYAPDTVQPVPTPTTPATSSRCTTPPARAPIRWNAPARNVPSSSRRPNAPSTTPATRSGSPATEPHPHGPAPRTPVPVRGRTHARPCLRSSPASHRSSRPTRPAPRHRRPRTPIHTDRCQGPDMTNPTTTPEDFGALLREALGTNHRPTTQQECTLTFPLDKVRSIAELAIAARKHAIGPGDPDARPRLWWIKGDGTYLMSNGITNTPHTRDTDGNWHHIVYADNWGPDTDPSTVLGSDDLHETLDLTQPLPDGQILIDMLRTAPDHATRFLLHITHDDEGLALTMTTE